MGGYQIPACRFPFAAWFLLWIRIGLRWQNILYHINYMLITEYVLLLNLNLNETYQSFTSRPENVFRINHKISSKKWIFMPHHGIHPVDLQNCLHNILSKSFFTHGPIIQVYNLIHLFLSLPTRDDRIWFRLKDFLRFKIKILCIL